MAQGLLDQPTTVIARVCLDESIILRKSSASRAGERILGAHGHLPADELEGFSYSGPPGSQPWLPTLSKNSGRSNPPILLFHRKTDYLMGMVALRTGN